jgi:hypothetical protein
MKILNMYLCNIGCAIKIQQLCRSDFCTLVYSQLVDGITELVGARGETRA